MLSSIMRRVIDGFFLIHGLIGPTEDLLVCRVLPGAENCGSFGNGKLGFVRPFLFIFRRYRFFQLPKMSLYVGLRYAFENDSTFVVGYSNIVQTTATEPPEKSPLTIFPFVEQPA